MLHFLYKKAVMKTCGPGKIPREDAVLVQGSRNTAGDDTTSELRGRNAPTGAPVTVPMSDGLGRNQGGTVEYFCIPPLIHSGGGDFLYPPQAKDMRYGI